MSARDFFLSVVFAILFGFGVSMATSSHDAAEFWAARGAFFAAWIALAAGTFLWAKEAKRPAHQFWPTVAIAAVLVMIGTPISIGWVNAREGETLRDQAKNAAPPPSFSNSPPTKTPLAPAPKAASQAGLAPSEEIKTQRESAPPASRKSSTLPARFVISGIHTAPGKDPETTDIYVDYQNNGPGLGYAVKSRVSITITDKPENFPDPRRYLAEMLEHSRHFRPNKDVSVEIGEKYSIDPWNVKTTDLEMVQKGDKFLIVLACIGYLDDSTKAGELNISRYAAKFIGTANWTTADMIEQSTKTYKMLDPPIGAQ